MNREATRAKAMKIDDDRWAFVVVAMMDLERQMRRIEKATDRLMIAPESPLIDPFYRIADTMIAACSELIGDSEGSLSWYAYECEFGKNPKEAGVDGDMRKIDSLAQLRWLIECENAGS